MDPPGLAMCARCIGSMYGHGLWDTCTVSVWSGSRISAAHLGSSNLGLWLMGMRICCILWPLGWSLRLLLVSVSACVPVSWSLGCEIFFWLQGVIWMPYSGLLLSWSPIASHLPGGHDLLGVWTCWSKISSVRWLSPGFVNFALLVFNTVGVFDV